MTIHKLKLEDLHRDLSDYDYISNNVILDTILEIIEQKHNELMKKLSPIKFYIGSWFEYNNKTYVLTKDIDGEPYFEKLKRVEE